jgi:rRNA-processing protein FCF1
MSGDLNRYKLLLLDTGPLLLYLVGFYNAKYLSKFNYDSQDHALLVDFLKDREIVVTPQVLAEISNLANSRLNEADFSKFLSNSINIIMRAREDYIEKDQILKRADEVAKFGITDTSLIEASSSGNSRLLLTSDGKLFYYCSGNNIPVIHINSLKNLII